MVTPDMHTGVARKQKMFFAVIGALIFLVSGCSSLPKNVDRPVSHAFSDTADTRLAEVSRQELQNHPGESGFYLLTSGLDAFVARAVLANVAERSIDAQYYLLHSDLSGKLFIDHLIKAADRGVRVRLLVDDMDLAGKDVGASVLDSHPNIEVRLFNPFSRQTSRWIQFVTRFGSVTRRMHNKSFTVDNQATILGGRNIGDQYFDADPDVAFSDADVLLIGPVVDEVSTSFDSYWNSELAFPAATLLGRVPSAEETTRKRDDLNAFVEAQADSVYMQALRGSDLAHRFRDKLVFERGDAHVVYDEPEKISTDRSETQYHLAPQLSQYFHDVHEELFIFSPYFVPGKAGTAFLSELSQRGVRVRIVTNSLASTDVSVVHAGYARYRKKLLRSGVELYEMKPQLDNQSKRANKHWAGSSNASLHSKVFIFDRQHLFIGSLNLDPRSVKENTEIGVVLTSAKVGAELGVALDDAVPLATYRLVLEEDDTGSERIVWLDNGGDVEKKFTTEPNTGFWQRMMVAVASLLPIESQL